MSIQIVEIAQPSVIDTVAVAQPSTVALVEIRQGPAGDAGGGTNSITSATTSDGTADLDLLNVDTVTATVTGTLTADHIHGNLAGNVYGHIRAGETLAKGDPVYVSGSHGSGSTLIPIVSKADASNAAKMPAVGIMDAAVANNASGHMVIVGTITELNTAGYTVNAELYVAAGGGFTATPPSARAQPVARVERANANNGAVIVKVNGLSASDATASTLVRRDAIGGADFAGTVNLATGVISDLRFEDYQAATGATFTYNGTSASDHRIALGAGTTGAALFGAADAAAARTTLGLSLPIAVANGGTGTTNGSITGTGALTFAAGGSNQSINLTPSGSGLINITGNSGNATIPVFRATNNYNGGAAPGFVNTFECLAPNLSVGNTAYIPLGVSATTNNRAAIAFYYAGSGSANNYISFGNFFGATGLVAIFPNGGVAIAASGTPTSPSAGCLSVSGTTASTSTTTGALIVSGGVGIAGAVNVGGGATVAGNVGIGTTTPSEKLEIVGGAKATSTSTTSPAFIATGPSSGVDTMQVRGTTTASFSSIGFMDSANVQRGSFGFGGSTASAYPSTVFFNANTGIAMSFGTNALERIRIAVSGNVGIGTTSPSALLDVNSDTVRLRTARTPASAAAAGNAGDICWDANYIYVCTATNTWKRIAISTWP